MNPDAVYTPMRGNVVAGSIRQITHEVLATLRNADLPYLPPTLPTPTARVVPIVSPTVIRLGSNPD